MSASPDQVDSQHAPQWLRFRDGALLCDPATLDEQTLLAVYSACLLLCPIRKPRRRATDATKGKSDATGRCHHARTARQRT